MICKLAKSKMYLVGTFTMAVILYVSTGIQFWLTKYFIDVLGFEESTVFISYAIVSLTGPTTGCAFGIFCTIQAATLSAKKEAMKTPEQSTMSSSSQPSASAQLSSYPSSTTSMPSPFCCGSCSSLEEP
jgi:hypothetical protein